MGRVPSDPSASSSSHPEPTHTSTHLATPAHSNHSQLSSPPPQGLCTSCPQRGSLPLLSPGRGLPGTKAGLLPEAARAPLLFQWTLTPCVDIITLLSAFPRDCMLFEGRTASLLLPPFFPDGSEQSRCSGYLLNEKEMGTTDPVRLSSFCGGCWAPRRSDGRNRPGSRGQGGGFSALPVSLRIDV